MPFIPVNERQTLQRLFDEQLAADVRMLLFVRPESKLLIPGRQPTTSNEARDLLQELAELSDKLKLEVHDASIDPTLAREHRVDKLPALVLVGPHGGNIRFFGLPAGYEFSTLVADLVDLSNQRVELAEETQQALAELPGDAHVQVFVTPT